MHCTSSLFGNRSSVTTHMVRFPVNRNFQYIFIWIALRNTIVIVKTVHGLSFKCALLNLFLKSALLLIKFFFQICKYKFNYFWYLEMLIYWIALHRRNDFHNDIYTFKIPNQNICWDALKSSNSSKIIHKINRIFPHAKVLFFLCFFSLKKKKEKIIILNCKCELRLLIS